MKKTVCFLTVILLQGLTSCSDSLLEMNPNITEERIETNAILSFASKEDLSNSINTLMTETKTLGSLPDKLSLPTGYSLYEQETYKEEMREFVPNESFAKLLNKEGEIAVNDTIYKITPMGTYYFEKSNKPKFDILYTENNQLVGELIKDKLYKISEGIYRYDTFYKEAGEINAPEADDESTFNIETKAGHHTGADPKLDALSWFTADRTTWFGKIVQNLFGATKEFSKYYPHTDKRRVRGSFYFYNYVVYAEIGAQGWTDKKNWIGWSKTPSDDLRVGWRNVVLVTEIPDGYRNSLNNMQNLARSVSPVQYMDIPGSLYKVNLKTMVIPDFDAIGFDKILNNGSVAAFNWLKSLSSQNQSGWEKAEAALVVSRTHIFTFFRDQDIQKKGVESYTHVFASQAKFMINVSLTSFPQSVADYSKLLVNIVQQSSKMAFPTLANGDMYVAAKFEPYWQGMRIKKKQSEVISTMNLKSN